MEEVNDHEIIKEILLSDSATKDERLAARRKLWTEQARNFAMQQAQDRLRRYNYMSGFLDIFPQFSKASMEFVEERRRLLCGQKRHRVTEQEEDKQLLSQVNLLSEVTPFSFEKTPEYVKNAPLRDYQVEGLNWLISLYQNSLNGILADEMGLGKTLQTISLIGYLKHYEGVFGPHLVIVPKSTLQNWYSEFRLWVPSIDVFIFHGSKLERADLIREKISKMDFEVCITSYEICLLEKTHLKKFTWQYMIIDEAHRIKNELSALSQVVREFKCRNRLLLTGTPLQNNIHELWSLLNFLFKDAFPNSEDFEKWFVSDGSNEETVVSRLHKILRPFLLRRIKMDVEKSLLPKKRLNIYVGMSDMQRELYKSLLQKDIDTVNESRGLIKSRISKLQNIVMQLRKCCNHPYLFEGAEEGPPYVDGDHLITNSGKLIVVDRLLTMLKERGSRALIFSQMSRMLNILEDYCIYRKYEYCRIDGVTSHEDRIRNIYEFNKEGSTKFIFLLTTRAGGLGINLATADTVITYDSDWNPQIDLQAEDRAHRIGQKKQITVYRLITGNSVEEKVIDRATQKLRLDQLVIQQGRSASSSKSSHKSDLLDMIRYGAKDIFKSSDSTRINDNIEEIILHSEEKSKKLDERYANMSFEDLQKFSLSGGSTIYEWEGTNFKGKPEKHEFEWIGPAKRERKQIIRNLGVQPSLKIAKERHFKHLTIYDHQFYPNRFKELQRRELAAFRKSIDYKLKPEDISVSEKEDLKEKLAEEQSFIDNALPLSAEEVKEKDELAVQGFSTWNRRDFVAFYKALEKYGRTEFAKISRKIGTKTPSEVEDYSNTFWKRYKELNDWERIISNIQKGETRIQKEKLIQATLTAKVNKYRDSMHQMRLPYSANKGSNYTIEEDSCILLMLEGFGYGSDCVYENILQSLRNCPLFRFNWFIKSRTSLEIHRRCNTLVSMILKEEAKKGEAKDKRKTESKKIESKIGSKIEPKVGSNKIEPKVGSKRTLESKAEIGSKTDPKKTSRKRLKARS